jgi:hypothetical protein
MPNHVIYIPVHLEKVLSSLKKEEESLTQCAKRILTTVLEQSTINRSNVEVLPSQLPSQVTSLPSDSLLTTDYLDRLNELEHKVEAVSSVVEAITATPTPSIPDGLEARLEILEQLANAPLAVETLPIELQEWIEGVDSRLQSLAGREAAPLPDELSKKIAELEGNLALLLETSAKGVVLPAPLVERFEKIDKFQDRLDSFGELVAEAFTQLAAMQEEKETPNAGKVDIEEGILPCLVEEKNQSTVVGTVPKKRGRPTSQK